MNIEKYRLDLFKPDNEYLGTLLSDNVSANIRLEDFSTLTFTIPDNVAGEVNPRIFEVMDGYNVLLSFGKDFSTKKVFTIVGTPMLFDQTKTYTYTANSVEYSLERKLISSWDGVEKINYFRKIEIQKPIPPYVTISNINPSLNLDELEIYSVRVKDDIEKISLLIRVDDNQSPLYGKVGSYSVGSNRVVVIYSGEEEDRKLINDLDYFYYKIYDNPTNEIHPVGYTGLTTRYRDYDVFNTGNEISSVLVNGLTYSREVYYRKDGLKLKEIWDTIFDNTNFILEVDDDIASLYRSNFEFNNISKYQIIKDLAATFDASFTVLPPNINGFYLPEKYIVRFYKGTNFGENKGLSLGYGTYLKSIEKNIDATNIITSISGIGKDNMSTSLVSPTGKSWEDYTYYLDDFNFTPENSNIEAAAEISDINFTVDYSNFTSRWISEELALKISIYQNSRNYIHKMLKGEEPVDFVKNLFFNYSPYVNLYNTRKEKIENVTKLEEKLDNRRSNMQYYKALMDKTSSEVIKEREENGGSDYLISISAALSTYERLYIQNKTEYENYKNIVERELGLLYDYNYSSDVTKNNVSLRFKEIQEMLDKNNPIWNFNDEDISIINSLKKDFLYEDSNSDDEVELMDSMLEYLEENKFPQVTIDIGVVDFLAAQESEIDHDKLEVGDKINLYFNDFNIDLEAQIKEFSIDFTNNSLSLVISTVKNYNKGFRAKFLNRVRELIINDNNLVEYNRDFGKINKEYIDEIINNIGLGSKNTNIGAGQKDINDNSSIVIDGVGIETKDFIVDHNTQTIVVVDTVEEEGPSSVLIGEGAVKVLSDKSLIEMSIENGFEISNVDRSPLSGVVLEKRKKFSVDKKGNIEFEGTIRQGSKFIVGGVELDPNAILTYYTGVSDISNTITYLLDGNTNPTEVGEIVSIPKIGEYDWPISKLSFSWQSFGNLSGSSITDSFTPTISDQYTTDPTYILLSVTFYEDEGRSKVLNTITDKINFNIMREVENGQPGQDGKDGIDGSDGADGPGIVYRGEFSSSTIYYSTSTRRDIVRYGGNYYSRNTTGTNGQAGAWNDSHWTPFGAQFSSVATDLLLANNATITVGLVMGSAAEKGFIRSYGANSLTSGQGFYFDGNGEFFIGNRAGNHIRWQNNQLYIVGSVTYASSAGSAGYASSAGNATNADRADNADNADNAGTATNVDGGVIKNAIAGGWVISDNAITSGSNNLVLNGVNGTITSNNGKFRVKSDGSIEATDGIFKGMIESSSGKIADFEINQTAIYKTGILNMFLSSTSLEFGNNPRQTRVSAGGYRIDSNTNSDFLDMEIGRISGTGMELAFENNFFINSGENIYFSAPNGRIYVRSSESSGQLYLVGRSGGNLSSLVDISSEKFKKNINILNKDKLIDFIEKVEIKEFNMKEDGTKSISIIIEDEIKKNNPFSDILFNRTKSGLMYKKDSLPEYLKEYKNTDLITEKEDIYEINPLTYKSKELLSITLGVVKIQHNQIKILEDRLNKLEQLLKAHN